MGIKGLSKVIKDSGCVTEVPYSDIPKGVYGVDVSVYLYPSKYQADIKGKGSHIKAFFDMIVKWTNLGHKLVMVFDGQCVDAKKATVDKRTSVYDSKEMELLSICQETTPGVEIKDVYEYSRELKDTGKLSDMNFLKVSQILKNHIVIEDSDYLDLEKLFKLCGVPFLKAEGEADCMLTTLYKNSIIDGVISEDSDMLTHGVDVVIRGIIDGVCRKKDVVQMYNLDNILEALGITYSQFVDVCILGGCDYCETVKGIAFKTGLKLIKKHGDLMSSVKGKQLPENYSESYRAAKKMFLEETETCPEEVNFYKMKQKALVEWLSKTTNYKPNTIEAMISR